MDAILPIPKDNKRKKRKKADRHGWNSFENYKQIYEDRIKNHPFVDSTKPIPDFEFYHDGDNLFVVLDGRIYCSNNIVLTIFKVFETRYVEKGRLQVRCSVYSYNASIRGQHNILRYDNTHLDEYDKYHKHEFDVDTGQCTNVKHLSRQQFPVLSDVLDELKSMCDRGLL